jgi:predicted dienelactone hydrolase
MKTVVTVLLILFGLALPASAAEFKAKMEVVDLGKLDTGRPAKVNLWYPEGTCTQTTARFCLAESGATNKVVVLSHGSMGSAPNYSWLGESLARAGFIVAGVNHYGESSIYGADTQEPRSTAFTWQRPQDISALLTKLAREKLFQREVDWTNVVAIGHSAGGQTVSLLAGARYDLRQLVAYCMSEAGKADLSCNYVRNAGNAPDSFAALFNANYQDTRVKKIVLMDAALGSALRQESFSAVALPSLFVGATHNDFLPWEGHGARYVSAIPGVQTILLEGQEGHFIFIAPCRHAAEVMGVPLCQDRPGVDRAAVQRALAQRVADFVRPDNEPATVVRLEGETPGAVNIPSNPILQVLYFTPTWVFGLGAGLAVLGLMQVRTRRVPFWLALLLPVAMLILSLSGVLQYMDIWWQALAAWMLGVGATSALGLGTMRRDAAAYDASSGKLTVVGSWVPLFVILGIFCVRYAMGVAKGMQLEIVHSATAQMTISLVLGALSGFFAARGLFFWRIQAASRSPQPLAS